MKEQISCESPLRDTVHRLVGIVRKHHAAFDALRESTGLGRTAHYMLMRLADADEVLSQTEIAQILQVSTAAVASMLKKLEADGYVKRQANPNDTRFNDITLTEKGREVVRTSHAKFAALDAVMFGGFSAEEIARLDADLVRIQNNLDAYAEREKGRKEDIL